MEGDIRNEALITEILHDHAIDTVIHFAGLKAVGESVTKPLEYYDNNVNGTLRLVNAMRAANVKNFIFSSSATVYGDQPQIPYVESFPTGTPQSPYGKSKLMVEQILTDLQKHSPTGVSPYCATSTRLARIHQVIWVKTRKVFLTT